MLESVLESMLEPSSLSSVTKIQLYFTEHLVYTLTFMTVSNKHCAYLSKMNKKQAEIASCNVYCLLYTAFLLCYLICKDNCHSMCEHVNNYVHIVEVQKDLKCVRRDQPNVCYYL